jgi:hypothetical protein
MIAERKHPPGPPMTLGNMRQLGVQRLVAAGVGAKRMRTWIAFTLALAMTGSSDAQTVDNMLQGTEAFELLIHVNDHGRGDDVFRSTFGSSVTLP